jgi:multiple sugar transport system substrate-binding protein
MIPGVVSWNDASNNKAFLAGEIHWTFNGISIYVAATKDPNLKAIAEDMDHAHYPIGPIGEPTELHPRRSDARRHPAQDHNCTARLSCG